MRMVSFVSDRRFRLLVIVVNGGSEILIGVAGSDGSLFLSGMVCVLSSDDVVFSSDEEVV